MPTSETLERTLSVLQEAQAATIRNLRNWESAYQNAMVELNVGVKEFERTGVAFTTERLNELISRYSLPITALAFYKQVAKDLNREFVYANQPYNYNEIFLRVSKASRLKNLVSTLIVAGAGGPIVELHEPKTWVFQFLGSEGITFFKYWREQCCTNPVMRITLGLPPRNLGGNNARP